MATRTVALASGANVNLSAGAALEVGKTYLVELDGTGLAGARALIALDAHPADGSHPMRTGDGGRLIYQPEGGVWWALSQDEAAATLVVTEADEAD